MKILLVGATGFIGKALLVELLKQNHELILLTRNPGKIQTQKNLTALAWDGKSIHDWAPSAEGIDAVINLAGEGIADKPWTYERKKQLIESRTQSTRAIADFIRQTKKKPSLLINASAVGYYGDVPEGDVTENSPKGTGFLAETCDLWENEVRAVETLGVRTVLIRIGIVLEKGGGALSKMLFPFQIFAGGPLGSGKQWFPWIHREDILGAILFILNNPNISGPVNLSAPNPLTMKDFCSALGRALHRPSWAPVPGFILRILLGEMADMLLGGQKALPKKLMVAGYSFKYPDADRALKAVLK